VKSRKRVSKIYDRASTPVRSRFSNRNKTLVSKRTSKRLRDIPISTVRRSISRPERNYNSGYYDYYKPVVKRENSEYVVTSRIKRKPVYVATRKSTNRISRSKYKSEINYKSFRYSKNRVAVLPFYNSNVEKDPAGRIEKSVISELQNKGYEVVTIPHDIYHEANSGSLSRNELKAVAERLGVEYVISGNTLRYHSYKKMRLAGLILGGIISGVHCYGDVKLEGLVYSLSTNRIVKHTVDNRSKKQVLGLVAGTDDLLGLSLNRAVTKMLAFM
jgi:TolB-like protein